MNDHDHDAWAELTAPPRTDPYSPHTEGPVRAAPVARNRQVLGYLWAGVDDLAAGFVPRLETAEDGAVAARKWAGLLQESSAGGLRPLQALAHWTTPGAVRGLRFGSIRDLPALAVLHELAGQPVVPTGQMPVVRTPSTVEAPGQAALTAPHTAQTPMREPAVTAPRPVVPPNDVPATRPPAQGTVMRYDRPVVTGQAPPPAVSTVGTERVPVGRAARHHGTPETRRQRFLDVPVTGGAQRVSTTDPPVWEHQRADALAARLAELDHVLRARPIPEDVIVWRVLREEELPRLPDRPEGLILESSGYQIVHLIAPEADPAEFARVRIRVPRGVPGLYLNSLRWELPTPQLLLARGLRTYVQGGMQTAYGWSLVGEVVWQAEQHGLQAV